jgi:hypothetical protein
MSPQGFLRPDVHESVWLAEDGLDTPQTENARA